MADELSTQSQSQDQPLGEAGYRALQAERDRARALEAETKRLQQSQQQLQSELTSKYEIDLEAMRLVTEQEKAAIASQYETKLTEAQKLAEEHAQRLQQIEAAMVSRKITEDFQGAIATELVNPQMASLLLNEFGNSLVLDDDGNTVVRVENKLYPLDALKQHCKETYPELFKPPTTNQGIGLNQFMNGTAQPKTKGYVSAKDSRGFLNNLDAIAKGEVRVLE